MSLQTVEVPGYASRGLPVNAGSTIRLTDVEGCQVADLFALVVENPAEYLCTARTRALGFGTSRPCGITPHRSGPPRGTRHYLPTI